MQFGLSLVAASIPLDDLECYAPEPFHVPHPACDDEGLVRVRRPREHR